jgi:hypothetical protein
VVNTAEDHAFCHLCGGLYNVSNAAEASQGTACKAPLTQKPMPLTLDHDTMPAYRPELDENGWKYVNAYGDCNSCSVQSDVNGSYMAGTQRASSLFFSLFLSPSVVGVHQKRGKQREVGRVRDQPLSLWYRKAVLLLNFVTDLALLAVDYQKTLTKITSLFVLRVIAQSIFCT